MTGFTELTLQTLLLISGIVLFAGLVHGTLGLGFPMVATPLLALQTDVLSAILIVLLPTLTVNLITIFSSGSGWNSLRRYWPLAIYGGVGSVLGTKLLLLTDPAPYKILLAVAILFYLNVNRIGIRMRWVPERPALAFAIFGLSGGFLAGTVNVMVPALIVFALEAGLSPTVSVQVFNLCFLVGKLSQALILGRTGVLTGEVLLATLPIAGIAAAALCAGMLIRKKIAADTYRGWMRKVLFAVSLVLIAQYAGVI